MTGPEMVAHAKALGAVIVCEDNGHTYPATLTYWHPTGRHKGRARVALANGTGRTVHHRNITVEPTP